jgi:hypothetical protein
VKCGRNASAEVRRATPGARIVGSSSNGCQHDPLAVQRLRQVDGASGRFSTCNDCLARIEATAPHKSARPYNRYPPVKPAYKEPTFPELLALSGSRFEYVLDTEETRVVLKYPDLASRIEMSIRMFRGGDVDRFGNTLDELVEEAQEREREQEFDDEEEDKFARGEWTATYSVDESDDAGG